MISLRAVLILLALVLAVPAVAQGAVPTKRSEIPGDLDGTTVTASAIVHYRTSGADAVTPEAAATVADAVEKAKAKYLELGFPAVIDDGDGKADVYYYAYAEPNRHGLTLPEQATDNRRPGFILLNTGWDKPLETVKHEYFHLVHFAITGFREDWLQEATASWARWQVDDPPADNFKYYEDYAEPLNCQDADGGVCAGTKDGYTRWPFFSLFDASFVREVFERVRALSSDKQLHGFDAMLAELAERGTTLQAALLTIGTQMVQGTLAYPNSHALLPVTALAVTPPATGGKASAATDVVVNHASLQFAALKPTGPCATVPLALTLTGPADTVAASFVQRGGDVTPLAIGETVVAWKACTDNPADVVFANGTGDADAQALTVTGRVVTPVLSNLKGRLKGKKLKVTVTSSAAGQLSAGLKPGTSRALALKAGVNRFALRAPKAKRAKLTLRPSVGGYAGRAVTAKVRLKTKR